MFPGSLRRVSTSHGDVVVEEFGGSGQPLLMIHGNSSCRRVFARQAASKLASRYRLITFDLPGHGDSDDAIDPVRTYALPGLADCTAELLTRLGIGKIVVLGWSLGGHIAIEMLSRFDGIKGLIISGTPPIRQGGMAEGFVASPATGAPGQQNLSEAEIDAFARKMFGARVPSFLTQAIRRSDGRFRERLFAAALGGEGVDQRLAVESSSMPIAVINGSDDPIIRLDYVDSVAFGNLWEKRCHRLPGAGHAPFWRSASQFHDLVERYLDDLQHHRLG